MKMVFIIEIFAALWVLRKYEFCNLNMNYHVSMDHYDIYLCLGTFEFVKNARLLY